MSFRCDTVTSSTIRTHEGGTYRDLTLMGTAADEFVARAAIDGLDLTYALTHESAADTPLPSEALRKATIVIEDRSPLADIQFETGLATLTGPSTGVLDQAASAIVAALDSHPTLHVSINGYPDNQGDPAAMLLLSHQRADAVSQYLASLGAPGGAMATTSFGDANPIASNDPSDGRAANRRVDFVSSER